MMEDVEIRGKKYTQVGSSRYKQIEWNEAMPQCQARYILMGDCEKPGCFDAKTQFGGPWADLCEEHALRAAIPNSSIGYHRVAKTSNG